ncbi:MAG: sorbosone dehydrogenase family protein [Deltaproteobacteria bacterium]|nr:sorbosone dehydrogenase family protein [Deltaproteobacteria bacterium]
MICRYSHLILILAALAVCHLIPSHSKAQTESSPGGKKSVESGPSEKLILPRPYATPSVRNRAKVLGWPEGREPNPLPGFRVNLYADNLDSPRRVYVLPNGDVLIVESRRTSFGRRRGRKRRSQRRRPPSSNRVTLLRDTDQDGMPDLRTAFITGLTNPYGALLLENWLYVGNINGLVRFPYKTGQTEITASAQKLLDLPDGGHYTRNVIANHDGSKLFVAVGSATNVDEQGIDAKDPRRAAILEVNPDGSGMRVFASGLRNPVGMDLEPTTKTLWTVVNERDHLGDELVPDFLTSVKDGAFYGWPYSYFGQNEDPRKKGERPDLVAKAVVPDFALGSHVAPLGIAFYTGKSFPQMYRGGAFIGMHGSWNRSELVGYKVVFVPFVNGKPKGEIQDFLTGFVADRGSSEVYGRPVDVAVLPDGSLLVTDDRGGKVWRVSAAANAVPPNRSNRNP